MQKIIAANWKMNKIRAEAEQTATALASAVDAGEIAAGRRVLVFPPFTDIALVAGKLAGRRGVFVGGQNFYPAEHGAFTGEISLAMLHDAGAGWVLVGHSERRHVLGEGDALIAAKTAFALAHDFSVMLCVGETLEERNAGRLREVLTRQLNTALQALPAPLYPKLPTRLAVAYEPVWAIGTGKVAGAQEVSEAHGVLRALLADILGDSGKELPIAYGGSVKPANAAALLALDNVDGLLVGGASLDAADFLKIINA